jgi:hypothetical protein
MEDMIMDELQELLRLFGESSNSGRPVSMGPMFAPSVLNVLWVLTTGASFSSRDDPRLHRLLQILKARSKAFDMAGGTLNQFPWMRFLAPERTGHNLILRLNSDLKDIFMVRHSGVILVKRDVLMYASINEIQLGGPDFKSRLRDGLS